MSNLRYEYPTYDTYLELYGGLHPTQYAELLGQEATRLELLGRYEELGYQIEEMRIKTAAQRESRNLNQEISQSAGSQTARYLKNGVLLVGTPALMINQTYDQGAEDLLALAEAASYEQQQRILAASIAKQNAAMEAQQLHSEIFRVLGLNDIYNDYLDELAANSLIADPGEQPGGGEPEDEIIRPTQRLDIGNEGDTAESNTSFGGSSKGTDKAKDGDLIGDFNNPGEPPGTGIGKA
jgi:hypothetical protein